MLALPSARYLPLAAACLVTLAAPGLRAQAPATASGPVVSLPPFVVQSAGGPPWRYTHPPGFEVLSRWSDSNTKEFADELLGARKLFDAVLPPEFQAQFSVPTTYVLVPDVQTDALPAPLMAQVLAHAQPAGSDSRRPTEVRFTPNLMLWDRDALVVFGLKPSEAIEDGGVAFFSDLRTRLMLERRTPTLPGWFVSGFYDLYAGMDFTQRAADTGAAGWISKEAVAALAADPDAPRRLLPLAELFAEPPAAGAPAAPDALARARLRQAEAALFIRWGLDGVGAPRRAALWKFVNAAAAGPVTEAQFEALFGEDYVSALNDLSDFLPWAATHSLRLVPIQDPVDEEIRMRDATPAEVGRIKGDWERLEMDQVALQYPELVPKYRDRAQETFNLAYQDDKSDPGLLAVMGLFAVDCGQPTVAEPLLRAAAAGHVVRSAGLLRAGPPAAHGADHARARQGPAGPDSDPGRHAPGAPGPGARSGSGAARSVRPVLRGDAGGRSPPLARAAERLPRGRTALPGKSGAQLRGSDHAGPRGRPGRSRRRPATRTGSGDRANPALPHGHPAVGTSVDPARARGRRHHSLAAGARPPRASGAARRPDAACSWYRFSPKP